MGCISPPPPRPQNYLNPPNGGNANYRIIHNVPPTIPPQNYESNPSKRSRPRSSPMLVQATYSEQDMIRRYGMFFRKNANQLVDVKVPTTPQKIKFAISKQPMILLPVQTGNYSVQIIRNLCFQEKMTWMRIQVEKMRVSWESGCEWLQVDRHDVLMSSYHTLQTMNLRKELKIKLSGEEVDDAGGVLREWMHLCIKDIFNSNIAGLFRLCKTDETAYRFVVEHVKTANEDEFRMDIAYLLGIVIGKALFDRIPLDCFLTRSIWRQVCNQSVQFCDFYSYDSEFYNNLKATLATPNAEDLSMNFTYLVGDEPYKKEEVELKPNGRNIYLTDSNKKEYVDVLVNYFCVKSCQRYIGKLKEGISKVIPLEIISIFEPHEMEMLLNGPQVINVADWKSSTLYMGYQPYDPQIHWFWTYVQGLDQQKLGNLLHFVTGSRRVPILGFAFLESNRNKINKFTIQRAQIEEHNPYPKAHTCFNRLELPAYRTQSELNSRMTQLLENEINSFGMS